jgi:hypothetical protein
VIHVDTIWLGLEPLDTRAGTESALARVVSAFGAARAHHGYVFLNRRLHIGRVVGVALNENTALSRSQFDALVLGLPW